MRFKIQESGKLFDVTLSTPEDWRRNVDSTQDLMSSAVDGLEHDDFEGFYIISQAKFDEMIEWWKKEVNYANADPDYIGDGLSGAVPGNEWELSITPVD